MKTLGVDVSHWEDRIDWAVAVQFIPFAYYKCTDGATFVDPSFAFNKKGCNENGIPHAPYHYYQPGVYPEQQAAHFVDVAGAGYHRYIVDVEEEANNSADLYTFLLKVEQLTGIKPAIYTSPDKWNTQVKPFPAWSNKYELIIANYNLSPAPILPIGWSTYVIWQFSKYFWFPGCLEIGDGNWFNGTLSQCREWFGNYHAVEAPLSGTRLRSQFDQLHVRLTPSIKAKEVDHLNKNDIIELEDLSGSDVWVKHARGWTCIERNGYRYMEVIK
jgi:GH25 family lysozyme M1 (1,4-beta-N-acetylmuramidase)